MRHVLVSAAAGLAALGSLACSPSEGFRVEGSSSDGLVFVRLVDGRKDLARARLRDGAVEALTRTPDRDEDWPYWSDAAGLLLLQVRAAGAGQRYDLVLRAPSGGAERPLAADPQRDEQWPMWSPDGTQVVFAFLGGNPVSGIGVADAKSGALRIAGSSGAEDWFFRPHFAPDGRRIVAQRRRGPGSGADLWLLGLGHPPRAFLDDPAIFYQKPWFTRDGREIVYSARPRAGGQRDVFAAGADGAASPRLVAGTPEADDHSAIPSPTRDEIAFVSSRDGSMDIFLAPLSGGPARNLTRTPDRDEYAPQFSPDGERLVFSAEPARPRPPGAGDDLVLEASRLVVVDREGRPLFETPGLMPDWMPPF